jgi:hypothetical protein
LSLEVFIISQRGLNGAYEDEWMGFTDELLPVAVTEILTYLIGSTGSIVAYWYSYRYFRRVMDILHTA